MLAAAAAGLLTNPAFRTFVSGAGFFADSYDLFVTDGVGNILKNLGPVNTFTTNYVDWTGTHQSFVSYTTFICYQKSTVCSQTMYANVTDPVSGLATGGAWVSSLFWR